MRIIATDIANLTDARYFAAWGVEGMAYSIDPSTAGSLSGAQLKEIVDWVEGPVTMIKIDSLEVPENLEEVRSKINVKNIIVGPFIDTSALPEFEKIYRICSLDDGWQDNDYLILLISSEFDKLTTQQKEKIKIITSGKEVFLDANFNVSDLDKIQELGFSGIILKGGEEEKVGFKSYDKLDQILEALYDSF